MMRVVKMDRSVEECAEASGHNAKIAARRTVTRRRARWRWRRWRRFAKSWRGVASPGLLWRSCDARKRCASRGHEAGATWCAGNVNEVLTIKVDGQIMPEETD